MTSTPSSSVRSTTTGSRARRFRTIASRGIAPALALGLTAACGSIDYSEGSGAAADEPASGYPIEVTNCDRRLTVQARPQRVVSLYPGQTELLLELGLGDLIVAQAQDAVSEPDPELADQLSEIPSLNTDAPPAKEVLISQEPDFVFSGTEYEFNAEMGFAGADDLEGIGATPYVSTAGCLADRSRGTVEDLFTDLNNLGRIFGVEERAAELGAQMRAELDEVAEQVDGESVRTALVFYDAGRLTAIAAAVDADMLRLAGGDNVFDPDDSRFADFFAAEVSPEIVSERDPEAFVFAVMDDEHEQQTIDYLRRTFAETTAVREDRLVAVRNTAFSPGTLATIEGVRTIADGLHPTE